MGGGNLVSSLNAKVAAFAYHGNDCALVFIDPRALGSILKQNQQPLAVMGSKFPKGGGGCGSGGGPVGTRRRNTHSGAGFQSVGWLTGS